MSYDYIIIGGGISGITFARLLQLSGVDNFIVLEGEREIGGLCRSKEVNGHVVDLGGGHFLCTKYPEVYDFVFGHIPKSEFNYFTRVSHINLHGAIIDYPLESNIWQLPLELCVDFLLSIVQNGESRGLAPPVDFEEWIRWKLGQKVAEDYMLPYNKKVWGVDAAEMDIDWLHKIPRINIKEIAMACLTRMSDPTKMPSHAGFYYPKAGGFQRVFDAIAKPTLSHIRTNFKVSKIEIEERGGLIVNGEIHGRRIINTAPWETLLGSNVFSSSICTEIKRLKKSSIVVSLHEEKNETNAHWCYEPAETKSYHREFYVKNYAPHSRSHGIMRETNALRWSGLDNGLYSIANEYAYPIPSVGWARSIKEILAACEPKNIFGLGRWGQWQYLNSDVCIWDAIQLARSFGLYSQSVF